MRGAPHAHCLLWLVEDGKTVKKKIVFNGNIEEIDVPKPAPTYKNLVYGRVGAEREQGKDELLKFIESILTIENEELAKRNVHGHRFTCQKNKRKILKIQPNEGHGKFLQTGQSEVLVLPKCRFGFPRFPMSASKILEPLSPVEVSEEEIKIAKNNFKKIQKFIVRQTLCHKNEDVSEEKKRFFKLSFDDFLWHLDLSESQYLTALQSEIKGNAQLFLQRETSQIFINNYNKKLMQTHDSNMDISIVFDEYQVAQYLVSYLTKAEAGSSKILQQLDEECSKQGIGFTEKLKKFRRALDQTREVSIQEAVYRLMGFPITKGSRKVKYVSTTEKQYRDGLLKGNLDSLEEGENPFLNGLIDYYESRPDELEDLTLADFCAHFEVVTKGAQYEECEDNDDDTENSNRNKLLCLKNGMGKIRRRLKPAVIRYVLNKRDEYEYARGLLMLFVPFRNETKELSEINVLKLYKYIKEDPERNEKLQHQINFYQPFQEILEIVEDLVDDDSDSDDEDNIDEDPDRQETIEETTSEADIEKFLNDFDQEKVETTDLIDKQELLKRIRDLNQQQRRILDDVVERLSRTDYKENPIYLYVSGDAGNPKILHMK